MTKNQYIMHNFQNRGDPKWLPKNRGTNFLERNKEWIKFYPFAGSILRVKKNLSHFFAP